MSHLNQHTLYAEQLQDEEVCPRIVIDMRKAAFIALLALLTWVPIILAFLAIGDA